MPTKEELKTLIDSQITNKTQPYSIDNVEVGQRMKDIVDLAGNDPVLTESLTVQLGTGGAVGGATTGEIFPVNTKLEDIIRDILVKSIPPTYLSPSASLSTNNSTFNHEIGAIISATVSLVFNQNDAGSLVSRSITKNGVEVSTDTPFVDSNVQLTGSTLSYRGRVTYAQGAIKNNNLGQPDATGRIQAGFVDSNIISYNSYRRAFWGTPATSATTSSNVRGLGANLLNPSNGTTFSISIPLGSSRVIFAYPATLQDVTSVRYVELSNAEVKGNFTQSLITVEGANGYTGVSYKVYTYIPVEPFQTAATYLVTI